MLLYMRIDNGAMAGYSGFWIFGLLKRYLFYYFVRFESLQY